MLRVIEENVVIVKVSGMISLWLDLQIDSTIIHSLNSQSLVLAKFH